ncbi:DUF1573 domain-containing protein [Flavobacterium sp.]|jgi:hypothetical protein|uniref:DUF1573 domain-containing protein n=1 Tax=Flavobacterium sp. TaxID=239 RepID=UPI0037C10CA7
MKKILLITVLAAFGLTTASAQTKAAAKKSKTTKTITTTKGAVAADSKKEATKGTGAGIVFESETIDYGTIQQNADGKREFVLTNNGDKPLIISNAQGSCGCTVPTYPKEPIAPGAKAVIGVKYDTNRTGSFQKSVTITSNAEGTATKVLTIKGNVLADETKKEEPKATELKAQ